MCTFFSKTPVSFSIAIFLFSSFTVCWGDENISRLISGSDIKCTSNCQSSGVVAGLGRPTRTAPVYIPSVEIREKSDKSKVKVDSSILLKNETEAKDSNSETAYYDDLMHGLYPNGTDEIHAASTGSLQYYYPTNEPVQVLHYYPQVPLSPHSVENDGSGAEGQFIFEEDGTKLKLIVASIWYLIIAAGLTMNFYHTDQAFSICGGANDEDLPIWHFDAKNPNFDFFPHEEDSLQNELYEMFKFSHFENSDEDLSTEMPDLSPVSSMCSRNAFFYGMNHQHMKAVEMIKDILMSQRGPHEMISMAKALRQSDHVNPKVWYVALMKASHERSDMGGMRMPGPMDAMPDTFIPGHSFARAISFGRQARSRKKGQKCIRVDGSIGVDNGIENLLWYFREDVMVNSHHWYWHLTFPLVSKMLIDRRGELFYYTHRSMTTRYNIERLCNGLEFTRPMDMYPGAHIPEGYNAHLTDTNAGMPWTDRPPQFPISDIMHQGNPDSPLMIRVEEWQRSRNRLLKSIDSGFFITPRGKRRIPHYEGIDILGNTLEAIDLSINPKYYDPDGYHNNGHRVIGLAVDPNYYLQLPPGPMADPATAMRDPIFYRWHTNTNNIFERYKQTLKPYRPIGGSFPLLWKGVEVKEVNVVAKGDRVNALNTFWGKHKFQLSLGLAFNRTQNADDDKPDHLKVCATHLDHEEFDYKIVIDRKPCAKSHSSTATVRIFLAPRFDLHGHRFTMRQQRQLFVHLDLFTVTLKTGRNVISRRSIDSALTIPFRDSIRQLQAGAESRNFPNCGCGWPHHLLLPRGTPEGMLFDLFVMITNGDEDSVADYKLHPSISGQCGSAFLYCGIQNRKFPDSKPMGYPFDREIFGGGHSLLWHNIQAWLGIKRGAPFFLEDYISGISNMASTQVLITHIQS